MTNSYPDFVTSRCKFGGAIVKSMTADDAHMLHMTIGVSGEAGELLDAMKKAVIYRKPLDIENVKEEIGDVLFYLQGLCNSIGYSFDEAMRDNMSKLNKRYSSGSYSDEQAIKREDK